METGSQIISYKGDAALGGGDLPAFSSEGFNEVMQVGRDLTLMNHQNNIKLFDQKIRDRDTTLQLIDDGTVAVGKINPEDKKFYDQAEKTAHDKFDYAIHNGWMNNKKAYGEYRQSVADLKDVTTSLQGRRVETDKLKQQRASERIPAKQKILDEHIKKQNERMAKDSHALPDPFQQVLDIDFKTDIYDKSVLNAVKSGSGVTGNVSNTSEGLMNQPTKTVSKTQVQKVSGKADKVTQTTITSPQTGKGVSQPIGEIVYDENGLAYNVEKSHIDFGTIKQNALQKSEDAESSEKQRLHLQQIQEPPNGDASINKRYIEHIKEQVYKYNSQRGFMPEGQDSNGNPIFSPQQIKAGAIDIKNRFPLKNENHPEAGYKIAMMPDEFDAISSLASIDNYVSEQKTLNPELNKELLERKKLAEKSSYDKGRLSIEGRKANAYVEQVRAKTNKILQGKTDEQEQQEFKKVWANNGIEGLKGNIVSFNDLGISSKQVGIIEHKKSDDIFTTDNNGNPKKLKPIGSTNIYDKYDKEGLPAVGSKVIDYEGGYYKSEYYNKSTGNNYEINDIKKALELAQKQDKSLTESQFLINLGESGITYRMVGEGGNSSDENKNANALRRINNKSKKKGEQDAIQSDTDLFSENQEE
jgi:hypothetical protein